MNTTMKWLAGSMIAALLLAGLAWVYRTPIVLAFVKRGVTARYTIDANRPVAWSTGADPLGRASSGRPPNIVLILADDLGWNDLTFQGGGVANGTVPTPNIDSIANAGVVFTNGYAANGTCSPSRAALMAGRYGTRFGFEFTPTPAGMMNVLQWVGTGGSRLRHAIPNASATSIPFEEMGMPASEVTIAEVLAERGYHTMHIGKWHLGRANGMAPHEQGFQESLLMASGLYLPETHPGVVNSRQDFDPIDKFLWAAMRYGVSFARAGDTDPQVFEPDGYLTDYFTDQAVAAIEANRERPFFLYLAHWAPHTPLQALKSDYEALAHIESHRERVYAAMIRSLDRGVGRVLAALEANSLDDNTLVIFTSDNGGAGYVGLPDINEPFRGWKITLFEGGIHVPFFAKWPGHIPAGTRVDTPVHHFDIYATAAAAADAPMPSDRRMDGLDLLDLVSGSPEPFERRPLFWRSGATQSALVGDWKLVTSTPPGNAPARKWLFDLRRDPTEQHDLSKERPDKLAELVAALAAHNAEQAPPAWDHQIVSPVNIDKDLSVPDAPDDEYAYWSN